MTRLTASLVESHAADVNAMLRDGLHIVVSRRNDYVAADLHDATGYVDNLTLGTLREVDTYIRGMRRALWMVGRTS